MIYYLLLQHQEYLIILKKAILTLLDILKKHKAAKNIQILNNDELKNWVFKIKNEIKQK